MTGPVRSLLRQTVDNGVPAYGYIFDGWRTATPSRRGTTHGAELAYLFPDEDTLSQQGLLVQRLHTYWINFINHQDPNICTSCRPLRNWPVYDAKKQPLLNITSSPTMPIVRNIFRKQSVNLIARNPLLK